MRNEPLQDLGYTVDSGQIGNMLLFKAHNCNYES
jgi:hypothetical protein